MRNKKIGWLIFFLLFLLNVSFVGYASADSCTDGCKGDPTCIAGCQKKPGPTGSSGSTSFDSPVNVEEIKGFLDGVLSNLKGLIITIAAIFLVLGALMYMMSGGNQNMITRAKNCVGGAVIGLALALSAPTFLRTIVDIFGGAKNLETSLLTGPTLSEVATKVLTLLLSLFGTVAIISLVIASSMYLTAYGDQKRIDTAKSAITYSIIGIIIALGAIVIAKEIAKILGAA